MRTHPRGWLVALALALSAACGDAGPTAEIAARRTASRASRPVVLGAGARERFEMPEQHGGSEASDDLFDYALPEGWKVLAPTRDRFLNLSPAGDPDASCYMSFLPGDAGGMEANVNRWRTQLGAEPLSGEAIAALPTVPLLRREGKLVEVTGTYTGMGQAPRTGFALIGVAVVEPNGSLFLKFTGPAPLVAAERERFLAFARSLSVADDHGQVHGPDDGHDHAAQAEESVAEGTEIETHQSQATSAEQRSDPSPAESAGALGWKTPAGWTQAPPRMMREVTFTFAGGGECYVTRLGGDAGGLRMNLDRWRDQIGLGPLDDEAFAALERVQALGQEVPVFEAAGTFKGMDGKEKKDQGMLGVAVIRAHDSLFVKLTGPAGAVRAERANFLAFVVSLEERP